MCELNGQAGVMLRHNHIFLAIELLARASRSSAINISKLALLDTNFGLRFGSY